MRRLLLLLGLMSVPCGTHAACTVTVAAQVPVQVVAGVPVVDLVVNGVALPFVFDTGAERSMVSDAGIARAGITRDKWAASWVRGISGYERHPNADPDSVSLGGLALRRHTLARDTTFAVGPLPQGSMTEQGLVGLLGTDFLGAFDLDLDLPHQRVTLYRVAGCGGRFAPWPAAFQAITASQPIHDVLILPITLDGVGLHAEIDSGSSVTLLTATGISRVGMAPPALSQDTAAMANGVGRFAVTMRRHMFASLRIGDETITGPTLWVADVHVLPIVDMLLGGVWLRQHRVWREIASLRSQ